MPLDAGDISLPSPPTRQQPADEHQLTAERLARIVDRRLSYLLNHLGRSARRVVIEQVSAARRAEQLKLGRKHWQLVPAVHPPSVEERADDLLWRAGRRICHRVQKLADGPDESRRLPDVSVFAALERNWRAPWRERRKHIGSKGGRTIDVNDTAPRKSKPVPTVDDLLDDPEIDAAALFDDPDEHDGGDVDVVGISFDIGKLQPALHPRPLCYSQHCESCYAPLPPEMKAIHDKLPFTCQLGHVGYGPRQHTRPAWKQLPLRWVPWLEKVTLEYEKLGDEWKPRPKEKADKDCAPIDMEPNKAQFVVATGDDDEGSRRDFTGYQIEVDEKRNRPRKALRRKEDDRRSRATLREQTKRDPVLLVHALTADQRAQCSKLFKSGSELARAGLYEYALLPEDHRNWKEQMLEFYDPANGMPPCHAWRPETTAPPVMLPPDGMFSGGRLGSDERYVVDELPPDHPDYLRDAPPWPAWNDGPTEFTVVDGAVKGRFDLIEREHKRPFGDDPLQGYTRKKTRMISDAVAIALKGEELPDDKMLAIVDIGGGARIGLREKEKVTPEIVVQVNQLAIAISRKVQLKAHRTRTLLAYGEEYRQPSFYDEGDWRLLLAANRIVYLGKLKEAKTARVEAHRDAMLKPVATWRPIVWPHKTQPPEWPTIIDQKLREPRLPLRHWTRLTVKELPRPAGAATADAWSARHGSVECIERPSIVEDIQPDGYPVQPALAVECIERPYIVGGVVQADEPAEAAFAACGTRATTAS
jgi:hypothetical protein